MNPRAGIWLIVAQSILFAAETSMVHHIGPRASIVQLALLRGIGGLSVVAALALARSVGWSVIRSRHLPLQVVRGAVSATYVWLMMYSYAHLPLGDATAISFTQGLHIAVFSSLILRERMTPLRWGAISMGVVGAALIAKPDFRHWNAAYLVALLGAALNGLAFVLNKYLQRRAGDGSLTTMFYVNVVPIACNVPLAAGPIPPRAAWPWLAGVLLFGPIGMYLGIAAVRHAPASTLGPYVLLRLAIAIAGGVVFFHESPDAGALLGALIIVASCLLAIPRASSSSAPPD